MNKILSAMIIYVAKFIILFDLNETILLAVIIKFWYFTKIVVFGLYYILYLRSNVKAKSAPKYLN